MAMMTPHMMYQTLLGSSAINQNEIKMKKKTVMSSALSYRVETCTMFCAIFVWRTNQLFSTIFEGKKLSHVNRKKSPDETDSILCNRKKTRGKVRVSIFAHKSSSEAKNEVFKNSFLAPSKDSLNKWFSITRRRLTQVPHEDFTHG